MGFTNPINKTMGILLSFTGFEGSPEELKNALRSGRVAARELPLLQLIEQALAQVADLDLPERGALLPILAELLERKLRAILRVDAAEVEEEEDGEELVGLLVELDEAVRFLLERASVRSSVLPVPAASLPRDSRLAKPSLTSLRRHAARFVRHPLGLPLQERFGVAEAWRWLQKKLRTARRLWFSRLGLKRWAERTVVFMALLEATKNGEVTLKQKKRFADLQIEYLGENED